MNNRELKFRLWNKNAKDFIKDGGNRIVYFDLINFSYYCSVNRLENLNDYVVQQFTGLFDKNNVPIYEGDIIKHGCTTQEYESVVSYNAPSFIAKTFFYRRNRGLSATLDSWDIMWEKKGIEAFNEGYYMGNRDFTGENYLEVIGNIFLNPELI